MAKPRTKRMIIFVHPKPKQLEKFREEMRGYGDLNKSWEFLYLDSFDEAVRMAPSGGKLIVVSTVLFYDQGTDYRKDHEKTIADDQKNAEKLAEMIKEINPNAYIGVCHYWPDDPKVFVDEHIKKDSSGEWDFISFFSKTFKVLKNKKIKI